MRNLIWTMTPKSLLLCAALFAAGCRADDPPKATAADIEALAQDAHVIIGDIPLTLPLVAFDHQTYGFDDRSDPDTRIDIPAWQKQRDAFRAATRNIDAPLRLNTLWPGIYHYCWGPEETETVWAKLESQLSRAWARAICMDVWHPIRQALPPNGFVLVDRREPFPAAERWTQTRERLAEKFRGTQLDPGSETVICSDATRGDRVICTAVAHLDRSLLAVWSVWEDEHETLDVRAHREARFIRAVVRYGFGQTEDFDRLFRAACANRRPGSHAGPDSKANPCPTP